VDNEAKVAQNLSGDGKLQWMSKSVEDFQWEVR
jgi:hypothetical protein